MKYIALFIPLLIAGAVNAQSRVCVLGSVHVPTKYITEDTLLKALSSFKPDIILLELDTSLMDETGKFKMDPQKMSLESRVVNKYKQLSPQVRLGPIDVVYRNQFYKEHNTTDKEKGLSKAVDSLYKGNMLNDTTWFTVNSLYSATQILNNYGYMQLKDINSIACMGAASLRQGLLYRNEVNIIKNNPDLHSWYAVAKENADFWDLRNNTMVSNIIRYVETYPNKRIAVIVGYFHKYALVDGLSAKAGTKRFSVVN
ncbi:MAG: hypothetical protein H7289_03510 [Mucilaginibacter sp.]|nr:hypothetical protein [Mucilaginibacter sp.]